MHLPVLIFHDVYKITGKIRFCVHKVERLFALQTAVYC